MPGLVLRQESLCNKFHSIVKRHEVFHYDRSCSSEHLKEEITEEEYERKLDEAAAQTTLPDNPDMDKVEKFVERINRYAATGEMA